MARKFDANCLHHAGDRIGRCLGLVTRLASATAICSALRCGLVSCRRGASRVRSTGPRISASVELLQGSEGSGGAVGRLLLQWLLGVGLLGRPSALFDDQSCLAVGIGGSCLGSWSWYLHRPAHQQR
jgi:hypothetical protein